MKKIFGLLALVLLMGCDDGDMTFNTFDFTNAAVQSCDVESNIIYKANGTEVLLLDLAPSNFINVVTGTEGRIVTIGGANSVVYRNYSGNVTTGPTGTLCNAIPPASPTVREEWQGVDGGRIKIVTSQVRSDQGVLTGYTHQITLMEVRFRKGDEEITISDNLFGSYSTPLGYIFNFGQEIDGIDQIAIEDCNDLVYKKNNAEALILNLPASAYPQTEGSTEITIEPGNFFLFFRVYTGSISNSVLCDPLPPITPVLKEGWLATEGKIKINAIVTDGVLRYKIYFADVIFTNSDNSGEGFNVGMANDDGTPNDYLFGTYTPSP
ncbi:MAG: hypothetical protein EOO45_06420 [Flavobacterium sp.]|nr:MAG: hypothetical protein EOO45_06420 [Flavobacterium sp.]